MIADNRPGASGNIGAEIVARSYGYRGDTESYDDLQNADLVRVIERRKGLPVALSILYLALARQQGWAAEGLAFPAHFLIRVGIDEEIEQSAQMPIPEIFAACSISGIGFCAVCARSASASMANRSRASSRA